MKETKETIKLSMKSGKRRLAKRRRRLKLK